MLKEMFSTISRRLNPTGKQLVKSPVSCALGDAPPSPAEIPANVRKNHEWDPYTQVDRIKAGREYLAHGRQPRPGQGAHP